LASVLAVKRPFPRGFVKNEAEHSQSHIFKFAQNILFMYTLDEPLNSTTITVALILRERSNQEVKVWQNLVGE
jgi:hypothetical protein